MGRLLAPYAVRHGIVGAHFYHLTHGRLAVQEFDSFVSSAIERVREAYAAGRHEGLKHAAQALADGRERLRRLPATVRQEMQELYEELELTLQNLARQNFAMSWESSAT